MSWSTNAEETFAAGFFHFINTLLITGKKKTFNTDWKSRKILKLFFNLITLMLYIQTVSLTDFSGASLCVQSD